MTALHATSPTLLEKLRGADHAARARFVHLYTPLLVRWGARAGVPAADVPDLIQDVLLVVLRGLPAFERGGFRAWLRTVFVNKWRDQCRKRRPALLTDGADDLAARADPVLEVDEAEYRAVLAARAAALIRADFNEPTWRAFWLTTVEDRSAAEVASELGLSANAVYLARSRVLQRLRAELNGLLE
jgi:RNA polymerase sigma-70 factor (ECF subfamily)